MSISHRRASDTIVPLLDRPTKTKSRIVRTTSDASVCLRRNQLKDTIAQYETIVKHLKNYETFMAEHPVSTSREKAMAEIIADQTHRSRQTQSLARHAGRTFTDFIMTDLLSTTPSIAHAASQTDLSCIEQEGQPLIQRLFQGKKTAFNPDDLQLQSVRIPDEMMVTYEQAKKKCFFATEELLYATKMIKIDRRGYKRHVRMLCLTSERVYIITKKDPYPKEAVRFKDILGITCSPLKDGFICLHTRETRDDRGDWIFIIDYPCEFLAHLFTAMDRNDNDDQFIKIQSKCTHVRRNLATLNDECYIVIRPAETFRIATEGFDTLAIFTP